MWEDTKDTEQVPIALSLLIARASTSRTTASYSALFNKITSFFFKIKTRN